MTSRIVIALRRDSTRSALGLLIRTQSDLDLLGEAASITELLFQVATWGPDVVVLDWDLLWGERVETFFKLLRAEGRLPAVVALSVRSEDRQPALAAGAAGFACQGDSPDTLLAAIRDAGRTLHAFTSD